MNPLLRKLLQPLKHSVRIKGFLYRCIWLLPERFRTQTTIRQVLRDYARRKSGPIRFVNIGANDGLSGDHLREFIICHGWQGLLVEPVPFVFQRLQRAYRGVPGVSFEQTAISAQDGTATFYYLRKNDQLGPGYDQIGSFSRDYLLKHDEMFPGLESFITSIEVPCLTLGSLFRKHSLSELDLILIDAEGYDAKIVRQIDFTHPPALVIFEHCMLSNEERDECWTLLKRNGYSITDDGSNAIARKA